MASGIQDAWWVHLLAVATGANKNISKIEYGDLADVSFSPKSAAEYEAAVARMAQYRAVSTNVTRQFDARSRPIR